MLLWSLQSPELQEHRAMHFSLLLGFSSTWLCPWKPLSCVRVQTLPVLPALPDHRFFTSSLSVSLSIYLQSYSEKCPLCTASPFSLQGHPWQWCNLYMQQRNHGGCRSEVGSAGDPLAGNTTKPKEKKFLQSSSSQETPMLWHDVSIHLI